MKILSQEQCLHEIFFSHVHQRPNAIALICEDQQLTYRQLNDAANNIANKLINLGFMPGDKIPILLSRSKSLVITILAVLKIGAIYSLLDKDWPQQRIIEIVQILYAKFMITEEDIARHYDFAVSLPLDCFDTKNINFQHITSHGDRPCCVFFTSGTTGVPKGVLSTHNGTSRLFKGKNALPFDHTTVIPLSASVAWDAFSLELWGALLNGGTIWIVTDHYLNGDALRYGIKAHGVNTIWMTSSLLNMVIDEDISAFSGLRRIFTGGERLSVKHVKKFLLHYTKIDLINGYGPVESTVFATTHHINLIDCSETDGIPLGIVVPRTQVYIIQDGKLCEDGEIGEIYIAGDGLALGYIGDLQLTAKKFIQIRLGENSIRAYQTGDIGYYKKGLLYYKGRNDSQIKIRGHRVEIAEVERQIEKILTNIRACKVISHLDAKTNNNNLVAFCIPIKTGDQLVDAMSNLKESMVSYQCPYKIIAIDALPLTANGKLDQKQLHVLVEQHAGQYKLINDSECYEYSFEVALVKKVFCDVLNIKNISLDHSFFDLGGTSIDVGKVCARLANKLKFSIPISWIYIFPSVNLLSEKIQQAKKSTFILEDPKIIPLTPMQKMFLTKYVVNPNDRTGYCLLSWSINGQIDLNALQAAINFVCIRHEFLRARYILDPNPMVKLEDMVVPKIKILDTQMDQEDAQDILVEELSVNLDPINGIIWRVAIVPIKNENTLILGIAVHHIAFDGWSENVLAQDLSNGYNAGLKKMSPLLPLTPTMAQISAMHASYMQQANTLQYNKILEDELHEVPTIQWPCTENSNIDPVEIEASQDLLIIIDKELLRSIDQITFSTKSNKFEVLFACWAHALAAITESHDFCIGIPVRQRCNHELENSIGCYINMVCPRIRNEGLLSGKPGIIAISNVLKDCFTRQDVPFQQLLGLAKIKDTTRPLLFQTLFAFQDNKIPELELDGLECKFIRQPYLELPLDLHAEIWTMQKTDELQLIVSNNSTRVSLQTAQLITKEFISNIKKYALQS